MSAKSVWLLLFVCASRLLIANSLENNTASPARDRHHLAYSARISRVERDRVDRLQQAAAHSWDRICKWSGLSIPRSGAVSLPRL